MKFDTRPIPSASVVPFTGRYMEAKVQEDFKLLNEITENYEFGYLTESEALTMLDIVSESEEVLTDAALDAFNMLEESTLEDKLNIEVPSMECFIGESVLPFKEIVKANEGDSIFNSYAFEKNWDLSTKVGKVAESISNKKYNQLKLYKETEGKEGFTPFERELYRSFPDKRVNPGFLYERVLDGKILSGAISMEEGFVLKEFVDSKFTTEEVAAMMPVVPLTGNTLSNDLSSVSTKDLVASTDAEVNSEEEKENGNNEEGTEISGIVKLESSNDIGNILRNSGAFLAFEAVVYKNNIIFDSELRKLFGKLQNDLKMKNPDNPDESFKNMLNVKKDRYTFNFANEKTDPNKVITDIVSCGFKPIKENGVVVRYEKETKGIKITIEFTSIDNGVIAYYESGSAVKESVEDKIDFGMNCDASDVKDAAKKLKKLIDNKESKKEDIDSAEAALDHAIENFKEVQKEKEVKESAGSFLLGKLNETRKNHFLAFEWVKESGIDGLPSNHPFFCKPRKEIHSIMESVYNSLSGIMNKVSSDSYVEERKELVTERVNNEIPFFVNESNFSFGFEDLIKESPDMNVLNGFYEMMENVFNEDVTEESFNESVDFFIEAVKHQKETESICETVLNNKEFEEEMFVESSQDIDDDIKSTVELLNRLGYTVKYSCSGHNKTRIKEDNYRDGVYHGKLYTTARITFDKKYNFKSIPDGWYENKNSDTSSIYVRAFTYDTKDGTPNEAFEKWKASYMKSLKDWAENLDKASEEKTMESVMDDIMKDISKTETPVMESTEDIFDSFIDNYMKELL